MVNEDRYDIQARARIRRRTRRLAPWLLGATAACSSEPPKLDEPPDMKTPLAFVGVPAEGPQNGGPLPQLSNSPANNEAGYMSTWVELSGGPREMNRDWILDTAGDPFTTPSTFAARLSEARDRAEKTAGEAIIEVPGLVSEIAGLFDYYKPESGQKQLVGYTPERARWLMERSTAGQVETFADPYAFAEMRQRGARLYCAATAAYNRRTRANRMMGKTMAAGVSVFGLPIDLTVVEPTISMAKPMRFDTGNADGAQAFLLPFEAGVRMSPLSFLPGLPELKIPVGFVTADSEVASRANVQGADYEKWLTMSHVDGFASASQPYINTSIPEFDFLTLGPITFSAKFSLDMGAAACAQAASYPECQANALANPGRLLASTHEGTGPKAGWPGRPGGWTNEGQTGPFSYSNAPWDLDITNWYANPVGSDYFIPTRLPDPLAGRMLQNNDKSMEVHTSSGTTLSLIASGGVKTSWLEASAQALGSIRAGVDMVHRFREQEEMLVLPPPNITEEFNFPIPAMVTSFTVTPASTREFTFGLGFGLKIKLNLGFLKKEFGKQWTPLSTTLTTGLEDWSENRKLRMDTAISDGTNANFNVSSHWPRDGSYGTYEGIEGCEAPQTQVVEADPPCGPANKDKPTPAQFQPIQGNICLWREPYSLPPDYLDVDLLEQQCWTSMQGWMGSGTWQGQPFGGAHYVEARVINFDNEADLNALHDVLTECDTLYARAGRTEALGNLLHFDACDGAARLVQNIIEPIWSEDATPGAGADGDPDACD
jgi:hypothetical protein